MEATMAKAYDQDLRERVIAAGVAEDSSARAAAGQFGVGAATAIVWVRRFREAGETQARRQGKPKGCKLDAHAEFLAGLIAAAPDITLREMLERLAGERGVSTSKSALSRFLIGLGFSFKKNRARQRTRARGRRSGAPSLARSAA
jgi:transposase